MDLDIRIPQIFLDSPYLNQYPSLVALQDHRIPVPTPPDVIVAVIRFSGFITCLNPMDGRLTAAAAGLKHKVLSANNPVLIPDTHGMTAEGGAAAGKEVVVPQEGVGVDDWMEVQPVQSGAAATQHGAMGALRALAEQMEDMEQSFAEKLERMERRLAARIRPESTEQRPNGGINGLEQRLLTADDRKINSLRWEAGLDLEPVRARGRVFPEGLSSPDASIIRHNVDVREMIDSDLDSWLRFYDIDVEEADTRRQKERVLIKYLGGGDKRFVL
ncbi:hypothetical protein EHS25_000125 [Saitozyma podzolica]|uniref:Uncharacterized protein n=1 Tax=Saitozyma podzolica TaxID=1890683 RepID=A0A427YVG2_9TREE|nr:hypothetical protein EHS25_000125 [Saitozyma podzolica]